MILRKRVTFVLLLTLALSPPLHAQRNLASIPDPDPEMERKSFVVADGFEVNLFAADPLLAKPLQMNFDPSGRLWVACSEVYPQIKPGQEANDKVLVLEDRDGDGKADKTTVFADGLLIPTGIEPGDGGAYVANSTELLHFEGNGEGKATQRRVVLSGFGTEDTHHILHTLRWGFDGMLYFNQSIYIHSHIETPHGVRRLRGGGIWQFRPETRELGVFIRGLWNPWGHHFDRWGQSFVTDGAGGEGINYALPGASYATAVDAVRTLRGLNPGSPKYCGEEVVSGRHLPDDWQGNIVTNDFRGNRVCRFALSEDGAGFAARELGELIKTSHVAFRPIDIKMGPDGAIYIADWYNPIIQHGEVDFRDPRRDHTRGRIWRVTAKGRPLVARPKLAGATTGDLLTALKAPEDATRNQAKRVLKERGAAVLPELARWVKQLDSQALDGEHHRLEALWTYQALDVVEPGLLMSLLRARDHRVRAAAARVVGHWHARLSDPLALLAVAVADEHPRVRLEAVRSLARIPQPQAAERALRALDRPMDKFLDYALWLTARELQPHWLPEVQAGRFDFGGNPRHLVFALEAVGSPGVVAPLLESFRAGRLPKQNEESALTLIAALGVPADLTMVLNLALSDGESSSRREALLEALLKTTRQRKIRPGGDLARLGRFLDGPDETLRVTAARSAGLWQVEPLRARLEQIARAVETHDPLRRAVIDGLTDLGGPASRQAVERLSGADNPSRTRALAIAALASLDATAGAARAVDWLAQARSPAEIEDVMSRFVQLRDGPAALAHALVGRSLREDAAKIAVRAARATGLEDPKLIEALTAAGHLATAPQPLSPEQMSQLAADVTRLGDATRGESIFRRKDVSCLKCHAIAGAGGQVGPSLESIGASAPLDYLIDSLLLPNKAVKENYHSLVVATSDGRVVSGIKVRQSEAQLVLRDADDREVALPLDAIDEQRPGGSLMPAGLVDLLTRGEQLDLIRFLSELGKIGPFAVGKDRVLRRWRVLDATPEAARELRLSGLETAARVNSHLSWSPAYSLVSGTLPLDALPPLKIAEGKVTTGLAFGQIDVSTAGQFRLLFNSVVGLKLWIDGHSVEPREALLIDLTSGIHTLTLAVDLNERRAGLRCAVDEVKGSAARAMAAVGK